MSDTVFKKVDYSLSKLVDDIELGEIGLPDLQRPFVWETVKVRDLFDSMYRGYPRGPPSVLGEWRGAGCATDRHNGKQLAPRLLIVDGQQRLTSLFAVMKQRQVIDKNYVSRRLNIAFRPLDGTFAVADATTERNPRTSRTSGRSGRARPIQVITEFLGRLREADGLEPEAEELIPRRCSGSRA